MCQHFLSVVALSYVLFPGVAVCALLTATGGGVL